MQFILDHIAAFIVFTTVALIVVVIQFKSAQSSAETVVNHIVRTGTLDISEMLERDIMNMRTEDQTNAAAGIGKFTGIYQCDMTISGDTTMSFTFPTLSNPQLNIGDPDTASVSLVQYALSPEAGQSITRVSGGDTLVQQFYRLDRFTSGNVTGSSLSGVTFFRIEYAAKRDTTFQMNTNPCPTNLSKVRFQLQLAQRGFNEGTDMESLAQLNVSRFGETVELSNWD